MFGHRTRWYANVADVNACVMLNVKLSVAGVLAEKFLELFLMDVCPRCASGVQ